MIRALRKTRQSILMFDEAAESLCKEKSCDYHVMGDSYRTYFRQYTIPGTKHPISFSSDPGRMSTRSVNNPKHPCINENTTYCTCTCSWVWLQALTCLVFTLLSFSCLCRAFTIFGICEFSIDRGLLLDTQK